ncbi:MAG: nuclear transport factor 2 family protein [Woeseia sp.]
MNTDDLRNWLHAYGKAWEARSVEAASQLFSEEALYFETPYAVPFRGREGIGSYWSKVTEDQRDVDFEAEALGFVGTVGVAKWSARFTLASSGTAVELNGVFLLEFDDDGLCSRLREWWHAR